MEDHLCFRYLTSVDTDKSYVAVAAVSYWRLFEIVLTHAFRIYDDFKHYWICLTPLQV